MEKVEEVAIFPLLPFLPKKPNKYSYSYAGEKYLIVIGDGNVRIDRKAAKLLWNSGDIFVYRIPEMQGGQTYTIETYSKQFHITDSIEGIQSFYDRVIFSKIARTIIVYGVVIALLLYFAPKIIDKYFSLASKVVEEGGKTLRGLAPLSAENKTILPWEVKENWIIERLMPDLDKSQVSQWRHQIRYNSQGKEHRFIFIQLKNGQWKLYEIWHPKDEYYKYEYYIKNQVVRRKR